MSENLDLNINIETKGSEVIGILRKDLKEANGELLKAQTLYGDYSNEAVKAANKVAQLRDKIQEARETSDLFDPGKKFQALTGTLSTLAGGFGAVQGAMALFGVESDNVQKSLLKVQSAMALSQGLSTIRDGAKDFQRLAVIIRTQVVSAFATLRSAIMTTGILALVAGIGYLISKIVEWTESTDDATAAQDKLNKSLSTQEEYLNLNIKALERANKYRISKLKEQGATESEITKANRENQKKIIEAYEEDYRVKYAKYQKDLTRISKIEDEEKRKTAEKASDDLRKQLIADEERMKDLRVQMRVDALDFKKKQTDEDLLKLIEKLERETQIIIDEETKRAEILHKVREKLGKQEALDWRKIAEFKQLDKEDFEKQAEERANNLTQGYWGKRAQLQIDQWDKEKQRDKDFKDAQIQAEYQLQDAKFAAVSAGLNLLSTLAGKSEAIANTLFIIDRALAIAQVVVNTQREIAEISSNPFLTARPDLGASIKIPAILGAKIRAGVSIASIAATSIAKFKNGSGSSNSANMPSMSSSAPIAPQLPTAQVTQLNQQSINDIGNQAVRAYVIESDITSSQQRITAIKQRARFS